MLLYDRNSSIIIYTYTYTHTHTHIYIYTFEHYIISFILFRVQPIPIYCVRFLRYLHGVIFPDGFTLCNTYIVNISGTHRGFTFCKLYLDTRIYTRLY